MQPIAHRPVIEHKETTVMMIFTLAFAMTVAMLIATAFGLHEEAQRVKLENKVRRRDGFRPYR
jgi:hypothetical protein